MKIVSQLLRGEFVILLHKYGEYDIALGFDSIQTNKDTNFKMLVHQKLIFILFLSNTFERKRLCGISDVAMFWYTVKAVFKDRIRETRNLLFTGRWSLCTLAHE